jgi:hypothetical protein
LITEFTGEHKIDEAFLFLNLSFAPEAFACSEGGLTLLWNFIVRCGCLRVTMGNYLYEIKL